MSNIKTFAISPGGGKSVYQPRLWIHQKYEKIVGTEIALFSMWRGVDKRIGEWVSYECRQEQLDKAVGYLISLGFQKIDKLD